MPRSQKIAALTPEQALRLPAFRAEAMALGTCTEPADRLRAEAAFARVYRTIGRDPVPVIWVDSPLTALLAFAALDHLSVRDVAGAGPQASLRDSLEASLGDSLWDSLRASLRDSLRDSLRASLRASLRDSLRASLGASLRDSLRASLWTSLEARLRDSLRASLDASLRDSLEASLWDILEASLEASLRDSLEASLRDSLEASLWDSLRDSLGDILGASLRDSLGDSLWASLGDSLGDSLRASKVQPVFTWWWGQQDNYWIAFYRFAAEIGVKYRTNAAERLDIMHEVAASCMWWYPRDGLIIACERPGIVRMDQRERLHCEDGPAVAFRDGWSIYAVHGVRVPDWVITDPARITVETIEVERNSEVQRVMIECMGWDRYAAAAGADVVDHDERWGTLRRRVTAGGQTLLWLDVVNRSPEPDGSFRRYALALDADLRPIPDSEAGETEFGRPQRLTALNAVASTFGQRGEEYAARSGVLAESERPAFHWSDPDEKRVQLGTHVGSSFREQGTKALGSGSV